MYLFCIVNIKSINDILQILFNFARHHTRDNNPNSIVFLYITPPLRVEGKRSPRDTELGVDKSE